MHTHGKGAVSTGLLRSRYVRPMSNQVRLHPLLLGWLTADLGDMETGSSGAYRFPVPGYLIEHPQGLVVVDAGLHPDLAGGPGRLRALADHFTVELDPQRHSLPAALRLAGAHAADVGAVVLTHIHFDHTGGIVDLPNARVVVQATEWATAADERSVRRGSIDAELGSITHDLQLLDGDADLFGDGTVTCLDTGGHTVGHQSIRVHTESGTQLICGDCCYFARTLDGAALPPAAHDHDRQQASLHRLRHEVAGGATPWFGHEPAQWAEDRHVTSR